jgi:hypothetical protein
MTFLIQTLEGASLLIAGILILTTLKRKGKNRLLFYLALFFVGGGLFRLGMFAIGFFSETVVIPAVALLSGSISNGCLYFGLAGYGGAQINYLKGRKLAKLFLIFSLTGASILTLFHLAANGFLFFSTSTVEKLNSYQVSVMLAVLGVSLFFLLTLFFIWFILSKKGGTPFLSNSTLNIGLGLMLISWMLQKVVQIEPSSAAGVTLSLLPFVAIAVVVVAIFLQTTSSMAPGVVYNMKTKQPVALAIVRVVRQEDKKLLESRVSSDKGRYGILVEPGRYILDVTAGGYNFPCTENSGYKGEVLDVKKPKLIGLDIFLDPIS